MSNLDPRTANFVPASVLDKRRPSKAALIRRAPDTENAEDRIEAAPAKLDQLGDLFVEMSESCFKRLAVVGVSRGLKIMCDAGPG